MLYTHGISVDWNEHMIYFFIIFTGAWGATPGCLRRPIPFGSASSWASNCVHLVPAVTVLAGVTLSVWLAVPLLAQLVWQTPLRYRVVMAPRVSTPPSATPTILARLLDDPPRALHPRHRNWTALSTLTILTPMTCSRNIPSPRFGQCSTA